MRLGRGSHLSTIPMVGERGSVAWALRIRSLHGFQLSPLRSAGAATPDAGKLGAVAQAAAALCAASMARIVANSRRRAETCSGRARPWAASLVWETRDVTSGLCMESADSMTAVGAGDGGAGRTV